MLTDFESKIQKFAIYDSNSNLVPSPIADIIHINDLEYLASGTSTKVFKIKGTNWVLKEGRWDLDVELFGKVKLPLPASVVEKMLNMFNMYYLPTKEHIKEQYERYLKLVNYLGYFENSRDYFHPKLDEIISFQKNVRTDLLLNIERLDLDFNILEKLKRFLENGISSNFIQPEYLLYGKSFTFPANDTYFIVQKYSQGESLHDINILNSGDNVRQIVELCLLILYFKKCEGLVTDTRPRYLAFEGYDWLAKTDNVMLTSENEIKLIDTRMIWSVNDNFIKRGLLIPMITEKSISFYLNKLLS